MEEIFKQILQSLKRVNINDLGRFVFSQSNIQKWIIETIQNRLERTGIDAFGEKLKTDSSSTGEFYSFATIVIKEQLGQETGHVTLKDTGDFYNTFRIFLKQNAIIIDADFDKGTSHIADNFTRDYSQKELENAIESLSESEINTLINTFVFEETINYLNKVLPSAT
jgi:hypothetical protein